MTCKVEAKDDTTRYANNPGQLPLKEDFVVDGSFEIVGHRESLEADC